MKKPTLDLVLIENRILRDGTFPVKLRVTYERCPVLIGLGISMKKEDYSRIWKSKAPRDEALTKKIQLHKDHIHRGNEILDQMEKEGIETFDFEEFKDRFTGKKLKNDSNILTMYEKIINELDSADQIGTAGTYRNSRRALVNFLNQKTKN
ncbi:MAG: hypothetical protein IPL31_01980 [Saprospiraceae bacterium]|nr:hypothetical protein [Saprospiraceae bacterium]